MNAITELNPLGIEAIDHLEFCSSSLDGPMTDTFYKLGFEKTYENIKGHSCLFSQGQVRFLINAVTDPAEHARQYFERHGEGVSKISFLVENATHALKEAQKRGATIVEPIQRIESEHGIFKFGSIQGFGDVLNEFIERPRTYFRPDFTLVLGDPKARPLAQRFARIDHLTNNVPKGEMKRWVQFYKDIFGMEVTRYFDIKGQKTGLESEVVQLANSSVIIPINEPSESQSKSQIQEFLDLHKGPGVQHIALMTADIVKTVEDLQSRGIQFLAIPRKYYENIPKRDFSVSEDLTILEQRQLLVDGDREGYLLQNFTQTYIGPLFFETIQRKNHKGFGEGNFQALFDSIEQDQMKRGYLK